MNSNLKYMAGYIYDGDISDLKPFKTLRDAESYIVDLISNEKYEEGEWVVFSSGIKAKHYYIDYNQFFIVKL